MSLLELKYAQVKKKRKCRKVITIEKNIFYDEEMDKNIVSKDYIEHQNLTSCHDNNRLARKTLGYFQKSLIFDTVGNYVSSATNRKFVGPEHEVFEGSKEDEWLQYHFQLANNPVRTHDSFKIVKHVQSKIWRKYQKQTPLESAGSTNHNWILKELLTYPYPTKKRQTAKGS